MSNNHFEAIAPQAHEFEGYLYLELNGRFYKGCRRCGGTGHYSFDGQSSVCYQCGNILTARLGAELPSREAAEKWCHVKHLSKLARDRKRQAIEAAKKEKMVANQLHLLGNAPDVYTFLMGIEIEEDNQGDFETYDAWFAAHGHEPSRLERNSFIRSMAETLRWVGPSREFTPKMIDAIRKAMDNRRAKERVDAARPPVPTDGRQTITGTILSAKIVENDFGVSYKIVVEDDRGFKVYGSLPRAQATEAREEFHEKLIAAGIDPYDLGSGVWLLGDDNGEYPGVKGRRIRFDAAINPSSDDKSFGFTARPTKGAWL